MHKIASCRDGPQPKAQLNLKAAIGERLILKGRRPEPILVTAEDVLFDARPKPIGQYGADPIGMP
jgi:hypothetical protein